MALDGLLHLINCHLPETVHKSKYLFLKRFPKIAQAKKHFFCSECKQLLETDSQVIKCKDCKEIIKISELKQKNCFFLHLPLKEQLKDILSVYYQSLLRKTQEVDSDIVNGNAYETLMENNVIKEHDISIQWNTDGVKIFNSSKVSMWPVQCTIK